MKLDADQQRLVTDHLGMAERIAARWQNRYRQASYSQDFRSAAYLSLCSAALLYDPSCNVDFCDYVKIFIHGAIQEVIRKAYPISFRKKSGRAGRTLPNTGTLNSPLVEMIAVREEPVGTELEILDAFRSLTRHLTSRQADVVSGYYGTDLTTGEIARRLKLSQSRVRELHHTAIARLRRHFGASA